MANISKKDTLYILINDATVTLPAKFDPFMEKKKRMFKPPHIRIYSYINYCSKRWVVIYIFGKVALN